MDKYNESWWHFICRSSVLCICINVYFYTLQIVGVEPSEQGVYTVIADNGLPGRPAEATVTLVVDRPKDVAAAIVRTEDEVRNVSVGYD